MGNEQVPIFWVLMADTDIAKDLRRRDNCANREDFYKKVPFFIAYLT